MEGRAPTGLLVVLSNCKDPANEDEFNRWYNEVHIPEALAGGRFSACTRWEITSWDAAWQHRTARYLALWETDGDPAVTKEQVLGARQQGRIPPDVDVVRGMPFVRLLNAVPPWLKRPGAVRPKTAGLIFSGLNNKHPEREAEFNAWYDTLHANDYLETPGVLAYHRFKNLRPGRGEPQYLGIGEMDTAEVGPALDRVMAVSVTDRHKAGLEMVERVFRLRCRLIHSTH